MRLSNDLVPTGQREAAGPDRDHGGVCHRSDWQVGRHQQAFLQQLQAPCGWVCSAESFYWLNTALHCIQLPARFLGYTVRDWRLCSCLRWHSIIRHVALRTVVEVKPTLAEWTHFYKLMWPLTEMCRICFVVASKDESQMTVVMT